MSAAGSSAIWNKKTTPISSPPISMPAKPQPALLPQTLPLRFSRIAIYGKLTKYSETISVAISLATALDTCMPSVLPRYTQ